MINIDDLLGVRYRENGRNPKYGLDCLGCAIVVERRLGHVIPDIPEATVSHHQRNHTLIREELLKLVDVKQVEKPTKEGDLILFKEGPVLNHVGVYLGDGKFIHCNFNGVHLEDINNTNYIIGRVYTWQ